jgi:N-acetylglutamate synthase-like GNAT family acetyltransferase
MIRSATVDDIAAIGILGERMAERGKLHDSVGYDPVTVAGLLQRMVDDPDSILLVEDDGEVRGMLGAVIYAHPFNAARRCGQELFWYSEGGGGGELLAEAEAVAHAMGVEQWFMICEEAMRPRAVGRLYERRGYRVVEHGYVKGL